MSEVLARVSGFPVPGGDAIDLEVRTGDVIRLVGPNGSGKTSLLRCLAGLDAPITPAGIETTPAGMAMQDARDSLIGLTVHGEFRLRNLPLAEAMPPAEREIGTLSSGEGRTVAVGVASHAPLLLLDEPTEGLDATRIEQLRGLIATHREQGAVVIADHGQEFADVATQTIALGSPAPFTAIALPAPPGASIQIQGFAFAPGLHAVVGPNGCGKTTWLRQAWRDHPNSTMLPAPGRDALTGQTVVEALANASPDAVTQLVPSELLNRHPLHLSGGEQQRVALAAILGRQSPLTLLDEPEAHLDQAGKQALVAVLKQRISDGATFIMATHDPELIAIAHSKVTP